MIGLIPLLMLNLNGISQTTDTVIRVKASQARKVYADALQKPILEERISILNDRIANFQILIKALEEKDSLANINYMLQVGALLEEKKIYQDQLNTYEKLLKRERRKRRLATAGGIVTTGLAIYLGFVK